MGSTARILLTTRYLQIPIFIGDDKIAELNVYKASEDKDEKIHNGISGTFCATR